MVFAIDGSKTKVLNQDENREAFDQYANQHSKGEVKDLVSHMFDVYKHFYMHQTMIVEFLKKDIFL